MIKTGIYGGSFNPIHKGHIELAADLCEKEKLDELWFMVSPQNPLKKDNNDLISDEIRLELAQLAIGNNKRLKVSNFEFGLPRPSFMVNTLEALRKQYNDREFVLIIGADNWLSFSKWKSPEEIRRHHSILIYPRKGFDINTDSLPEGVKMADTPLIDISSTEIRECIAQGKDASYGLVPEVWERIKEKGYYK